jgi:two-component system, NarL family, response regulator NreC
MTTSRVRVLVADDHTLVRETLVSALRLSGVCEIVGEASDGLEACELAESLRPDIVIVDLSMPRLNGLEVIRRLHGSLPDTRLLVLTMHDEPDYVVHAVHSGASGYLAKSCATAELLDAIDALRNGGTRFSEAASKALAQHKTAPAAPRARELTPREREVYQLIVRGRTTREIAEALGISSKTAEHHRMHVIEKLGVRNTAELVRRAMTHKLID